MRLPRIIDFNSNRVLIASFFDRLFQAYNSLVTVRSLVPELTTTVHIIPTRVAVVEGEAVTLAVVQLQPFPPLYPRWLTQQQRRPQLPP